jgi:hypothetical protein
MDEAAAVARENGRRQVVTKTANTRLAQFYVRVYGARIRTSFRAGGRAYPCSSGVRRASALNLPSTKRVDHQLDYGLGRPARAIGDERLTRRFSSGDGFNDGSAISTNKHVPPLSDRLDPFGGVS